MQNNCPSNFSYSICVKHDLLQGILSVVLAKLATLVEDCQSYLRIKESRFFNKKGIGNGNIEYLSAK